MSFRIAQSLAASVVVFVAPIALSQQQPPRNPQPTGGGSGTMGVGRLQTGVPGSIRNIQPARLEYTVTNPGGTVLILQNGYGAYNPYAFGYTGLPHFASFTRFDGHRATVGVVRGDAVITIGSPGVVFGTRALGVFDGQSVRFGQPFGAHVGVHSPGVPFFTRLDDVFEPILIGSLGPIDPRLEAQGSSGGVPPLLARTAGAIPPAPAPDLFAEAMAEREWERAVALASDADPAGRRLRGAALVGASEFERGGVEMAAAYRAEPGLAARALTSREIGIDGRDLRMLVTRSVRAAHRLGTAESWLSAATLVQTEGRTDVARRLIERAAGLGLDPIVVEAFEQALGSND